MTTDELARQTARQLEALRTELAGTPSAEQVTAVGNVHFERLRQEATVQDFIPLLVYRFTKEELVYSTRDRLHDAA